MSRFTLSELLECLGACGGGMVKKYAPIGASTSAPNLTHQKLVTAIEMLQKQTDRLQVKATESQATARVYARRGMRAEAKIKLRECGMTRKRLVTAQVRRQSTRV